MNPVDALFRMDAFATPAEVDEVISSGQEIAAEVGAVIHGPASVGGGRLLSIWPAVGEAAFMSLAVRPFSRGAWTRVTAQVVQMEAFEKTDEIAAALRSKIGTLDPGVLPPARERDYDRSATQLLEEEIQELLEAMAADPSAWEYLTGAVFERELLLQHLTDLGA